MRSDRDLDDAIDRAVRDIMSVEPRAGLRGRVLDRLERRPGPGFALPRLAGAAAAIAVAVIAFVLLRPAPEGPAHAPAQTTSAERVPASRDDTPAGSDTASTEEPVAETARRQAPSPPRSAVSPRRPDFPAPGMVTAATVAAGPAGAFEATDFGVLPLVPDAEPIAIAPIAIVPLTAPEPIVVRPLGRPR